MTELTLRDYQQIDAQLMSEHKYFLNCSELGTGKTAVAIETVRLARAKTTLVITPASIKLQWRKEIKKWSHFQPIIQIVNISKDVIAPEGREYFCIINYDLIIRPEIFKQLKDVKWNAIICDESHRLKEGKAKRTKAVLGRKGLVHNTERMYLLTGTPVLNRPIELFTAMSVLASRALKPYDNWYRYVYRFCGAYKDRMGRLHVNGATNLPDLKKRLEKFMIRRLADDTLPEVTYTDVELDVDICISEQDPVATRRRETGLQKVPQAVSFIKDILEEVDKVVIIFYHREVVVNLAEELIKYGTLVVMGGMSAEMKDIAIQDFYNSRRRVFFLQINCAEGLDGLQHNAHVGIFVEQEWSPSIAKQAVGRLHRSGQSHPVLIYNLITTNSLDERIEEVLDRKEKIIGELI